MKNNQLRMGVNVEKEHKKTIRFIKSYVKKNKTFPANKTIFQSIAKDHLKEDKRYYSKLKKAKL